MMDMQEKYLGCTETLMSCENELLPFRNDNVSYNSKKNMSTQCSSLAENKAPCQKQPEGAPCGSPSEG